MMKKIISIMVVSLFLLIAISTSNAVETKTFVSNDNETEYYAVIAAATDYPGVWKDLPINDTLVKSIYYALISNNNWKPENIIFLFNNESVYPYNQEKYEDGATRANILEALQEMSERVDNNDIFLFSWQGHGANVEDEGIIDESDALDEVIAPRDAYRDSTDMLHNYITDDQLNDSFSKINAEGMLLIFESCLSGGLVGEEPYSHDVNGPGRVVYVSTLDGFLGRASYVLGFPMTFMIGRALDQNSKYIGNAEDLNNDGYISAEELFEWSYPSICFSNSLMWIGMWSICFIVGTIAGASPLESIIEATKYIFEECFYSQLYCLLVNGYFYLNHPQMIDEYDSQTSNGELLLIESTGEKETEDIQISSMPEIWNNPDYESLPDEFKSMIDKDEYEAWSWYDVDEKYWPTLQAEASYTRDLSSERTIQFTGEGYNGPRDFSYYWDFGDGQYSNEQNPKHSYENEGTYNVKLTVEDKEDRTAEYVIDNMNVKKTRSKSDIFYLNNFISNLLSKLKLLQSFQQRLHLLQ